MIKKIGTLSFFIRSDISGTILNPCIKKIDEISIKMTSTNTNYQFNIARQLSKAITYHKAEQFQQAEKIYKKILSVDSNNAETLHLLGDIAQKTGKSEIAVILINKAILINPNNSLYHYTLGLLLMQQGNSDEAIFSFKQAIRIDPADKEAYNNLGLVYQIKEKFNKAIASYKKAVAIDPDYFKSYNNLGSVFQAKGNPEEAIKYYKKALSLNSNYAEALNNLGSAFQAQGELNDALEAYQSALRIKPEFVEAYRNLGSVYYEKGNLKKAVEIYKLLLTYKPDDAKTYRDIGVACQIQGNNETAAFCLKNALVIKPDYCEAYQILANLKQYKECDNEVCSMMDLYHNHNISNEQKIHLAFALGKAFNDLGKSEKSFEFISKANYLKRNSYKYNISKDIEFIDNLKYYFNEQLLNKYKNSGELNNTPIFVLGMPRSGTTLVEQILSSHPEIHGAGELNILNKIVKNLCKKTFNSKFPECLPQLSLEHFQELGAKYVKKIRYYSTDKKYIIDKMPHNFLFIGMIRLILPNAKIIHCKRNPVDTCFSIFNHHFTGTHKYAYDMKELGKYYNCYKTLMEYWHCLLPDYIYDIQYESLIADQKNETRNLLEHCKVSWSDKCLSFHKNSRPVKTASTSQVRLPIYSSSINYWKKYKNNIKPLLNSLFPEVSNLE